MGGPHVAPEMERLIIDTWLTMRTNDYEPAAKEVRYSVIRQLEKQGYSESDIPKLRTFQEYLRRARKKHIELKGLPIDEQKLWTMASLNELELSPEAIPYVLQVWRYSVNLGAEFTIRQAKWVARLLRLEKRFNDLENPLMIALYWLSWCSGEYAYLEMLASKSGIKCNTENFDREIAVAKIYPHESYNAINVLSDMIERMDKSMKQALHKSINRRNKKNKNL